MLLAELLAPFREDRGPGKAVAAAIVISVAIGIDHLPTKAYTLPPVGKISQSRSERDDVSLGFADMIGPAVKHLWNTLKSQGQIPA